MCPLLPVTSAASLGIAALVAAGVVAQSPPPTGATAIVGTVNQTQAGGRLGEQRIGGICASTQFRPNSPIGAGGVVPGGSMCWWSEALHPSTTPPTLHPAGSCITLFLVSPFIFSSLQVPFATPGFDMLFLPPLATVALPAPWTQVMTSGGGGAVIPTGGFDRWFLTVDVPNIAVLVGTVWSSQAVRLDPSNLQFYFSNEYLIQVWQ